MYPKVFTQLREMKFTVVVILLVLLLIKYLGRKFSRQPRWVQVSKKLPGPYALPVIGNIISLLLGAKDGAEQLFSHYASVYGSTYRLWIGNHLAVVLSDVEDIETVLLSSSCLKKSELLLFTRGTFGNSLPVADPVDWKHKRKTFQPFFNKNTVLPQITAMNELIYKRIEEMKKLVGHPESDWKHKMDDLASNMFFSKATDMRALERYSTSMLLNCLAPVHIWNWFQPLHLSKIKKSVIHIINKAIDSNETPTVTFTEKEGRDEEMNSVLAQSFLQTLKKVQKEFGQDDVIYHELGALLVAATETTGTTGAGCLFALAAHPEIQDQVYAEIHQVFSEDDRPADKSDLEKLPYLDQVIKETQRLFTVLPFLMRQPQNDMKIGPHIYPAGTTIILNIGRVHHDPKLYPDPYRFNPDNFSFESIKNRHRFSFLPFSGGPRNCLGKALAEITLKLQLIALIRTFTFHTTKKMEDFKLRPGIVEKSAFGYPISIALRK